MTATFTEKSLSNIWEIYGLISDPFYVGPILVFGGNLPRSTFIGRNKEKKRLLAILRSRGGSRILVSGEPGVGKTSFVNVVRSEALDAGFFTPMKEIGVQPEWEANDFILNTLFAIYNTLVRQSKEEVLSKNLFLELQKLVTSVNISSYSGSISVAGYGVGGSKNDVPNVQQITTSYLLDIFERIILDLTSKESFSEVIIHYNNLENFKSDELALLFKRIRDFILTEKVHFIFVGDLTVPPIIQSVPRAQSIFSDTPIILESLSFEETLQILEKRVETLKIPGLTHVTPYTVDAVKLLYDLYNGNIRYILNSLSTAIRELSTERPIILDNEIISNILSKVAEDRWLSKLSHWEKEILGSMLNKKEMSNKELSQKLHKKPQNISKALKKLQEISSIYLNRTEGTSKLYAVHPSVKWFLLSNKTKNKIDDENLLKYFVFI
ncbi:AAA family ATPase [Candidatus Woesearchaeota archaeon]|nr:AAA family ATPase [Candidatus Woesearchaeota archaeon]